jgi:hypothetical protein
MTLCVECVTKKQNKFEEIDCPKCKINEIVVGSICRQCSYKFHLCSVCQIPLPVDSVEVFQWKAVNIVKINQRFPLFQF